MTIHQFLLLDKNISCDHHLTDHPTKSFPRPREIYAHLTTVRKRDLALLSQQWNLRKKP